MSFLICDPTVFAIGDRYEILVNTAENGQCGIRVGGTTFYNERAGILVSETTTHKIAVPKALLEEAGAYTVWYRKTIIKKNYYSEFEDAEEAEYTFKALTKTENIHLYHVADVHSCMATATKAASYFGDELDVLVVNGDIAEVNEEEDFLKVARFMGNVAKGSVPVIFVRGNHDTRGKMAVQYGDYYPTENGETYYTVELGSLAVVALDCGEDKWDDCPEYGGTNRFEPFRRRETAFLKALPAFGDKIIFAISHIAPTRTVHVPNPKFEIEKDTYTEWNRELERLGVKFLLTGHIHKAELVPPNGGNLPHNYPLIVGSEQKNGYFLGCGMIIDREKAEVFFNDAEHTVTFRETIML